MNVRKVPITPPPPPQPLRCENDLLVGEDEESRLAQLVAFQHPVQLLLCDGETLSVRAIHHQDYELKK